MSNQAERDRHPSPAEARESADASRGIWSLPSWRDPANHADGFGRLKELNSALMQEDLDRGSAFFRGLPEVVLLNHSDICNLRCVMCPRHDVVGRTRLDRDALERIARQLFPTARKLGLPASQAEPMANDFELLIEHAARYGVRVDMTTNGTLLTLDRYREAREVLDHLEISIDSIVPETYEAIRVGADFDRLHANIQALKEERARAPDDVLFTLSAVVMKSNLLELVNLVEFARDAGADALVLKALNHDAKVTLQEEPDLHGEGRTREVLMECREAAMRAGLNLVALTRRATIDPDVTWFRGARRLPYGPVSVPRSLCSYLAHTLPVTHTGDVYACLTATSYLLGNVREDEPIQLWNGPVVQKLRAAHFARRPTAFCSGCPHAPHLSPPGLGTRIRKRVLAYANRARSLGRLVARTRA